MLLCGEHLGGFGRGQLVDSERGRKSGHEQASQPGGPAVVERWPECLAEHGKAIEPPQRFHHDVRGHYVLFQVMQERMACMDPLGASLMTRHLVV